MCSNRMTERTHAPPRPTRPPRPPRPPRQKGHQDTKTPAPHMTHAPGPPGHMYQQCSGANRAQAPPGDTQCVRTRREACSLQRANRNTATAVVAATAAATTRSSQQQRTSVHKGMSRYTHRSPDTKMVLAKWRISTSAWAMSSSRGWKTCVPSAASIGPA